MEVEGEVGPAEPLPPFLRNSTPQPTTTTTTPFYTAATNPHLHSPSSCQGNSSAAVLSVVLLYSGLSLPSPPSCLCSFASSASSTSLHLRAPSRCSAGPLSPPSSALTLRTAPSHLPSSLSSSPRRSFASSTASTGGGGLFSSLTGRLSSAMEERKVAAAEDKFGGMVRDMLESERWTLEHQRALLRSAAGDAGVSGWKSWLPGVSSQAGAEELKKTLGVLDGFTAEERGRAELIDRATRLRVAEAGKVTVADVNFVLKQHMGAVMVHRWLHERRNKGKPLPSSQAEMVRFMTADKPTPDPIMRHKPRRR